MTGEGVIGDLVRILTFQAGYNTSVVLIGATVLGLACGLVGALVLLRKRSLMSDSISHSTLPGVGLAFLLSIALGGTGRDLGLLMAGAAFTAALGVLSVQWIRDHTRLPEDAAIGTVLSVYYGIGIVLLSIIQALDVGSQAGLNGFLLGAVASLRQDEAWLIAGVSAAVIAVGLLLFKEFVLLAFDSQFASASGWPVHRLDLLLMVLLLAVVSIGLKTVGMVLIIAIVIIPATAARFWTDRVGVMVWVAALIGGLSSMIGVAVSALVPNVPTGAVIVLTAGGFFAVSMLIGPARGVVLTGVKILHWRYRIWECRVLAMKKDGQPVGCVARLILRLRRAVGRDGRLTETGARLAARAEAELARLSGLSGEAAR